MRRMQAMWRAATHERNEAQDPADELEGAFKKHTLKDLKKTRDDNDSAPQAKKNGGRIGLAGDCFAVRPSSQHLEFVEHLAANASLHRRGCACANAISCSSDNRCVSACASSIDTS
jgi:hypothetical protein